MPFQIHDVEVVDGGAVQNSDRVLLGIQANVANVSGVSAGATVSTAVTFSPGALPSGGYVVMVTPSQPCFDSVSSASKTTSGFTVVLAPTVSTGTISAGTIDVLVVG